MSITLESLQNKYKDGEVFDSEDMEFLLQLQVNERGADFVYRSELGEVATGCYNTQLPFKKDKGGNDIIFDRQAIYTGPEVDNAERIQLNMRKELDWDATPVKGCLIGSGMVDLVGDVHKVPRAGSAVSTFRQLDVRTTAKAKALASAVQNYQDNGEPWGVAMTKGKAEVERLYGSNEDSEITFHERDYQFLKTDEPKKSKTAA